MTTALDLGDRGCSMLARWPKDHPEEAKRNRLVKRDRTCVGFKGQPCQRVFEQVGVSRTWLSKLTESERVEFLKSCEVTSNGSAWLTARCARCQRTA
jgi:hypothetical protein